MDMYMKIAWQKGACGASNVCLLSPFFFSYAKSTRACKARWATPSSVPAAV